MSARWFLPATPSSRLGSRLGSWRGSWLGLLLGLLLAAAAGTARADGEMPAPAPRFPESGRLLATSGAISLEGAGGGGLVPWALITGYGSRDQWGGSLHGTVVRLPDFTLGAVGAGIGLFDRLELSYQHQWFDTGSAGRRLGLGQGFAFEQDIFGAKLRLLGDVVADQDRWWPQVSIGLQHKIATQRDIVRAVGARDAAGTDFYIAGTKLLLDQGLLLNGTIRFTRANQFGLLGHGGDRDDAYSAQLEGSAALLLSRRFAIGTELRTRPNNLRFANERLGFDAFAAWFPTPHLSVVAAYVDLGPIANQGRQNGFYLSLQLGF